MKDFHTQELDDSLDLMRSFIEVVKELEDQDVTLSDTLTEAIQAEIDKVTGSEFEPEPVAMTDEEMEKMMKVLASGKPIITEEILETIQRLVKLPGITTLHYVMKGHDHKPFRGKMVCYAVRSADGDEVQLPKMLRTEKRKTIIRPLTERRNLFTLSDNMARGPKDDRWTNVVTRFSAAYTILNQIVQGMQSEQILQPEDATPDRIDQVLHSEGDQETGKAEAVSGRTEETSLEDTKN